MKLILIIIGVLILFAVAIFIGLLFLIEGIPDSSTQAEAMKRRKI